MVRSYNVISKELTNLIYGFIRSMIRRGERFEYNDFSDSVSKFGIYFRAKTKLMPNYYQPLYREYKNRGIPTINTLRKSIERNKEKLKPVNN